MVLEDDRQPRIFRAERFFNDREGPMEEWLGLGVAALGGVEQRQPAGADEQAAAWNQLDPPREKAQRFQG